MVRYRKRKATEPEHRGQDRSRGSDWHGGSARVFGQEWQTGSRRISNATVWDRISWGSNGTDRVSKVRGGRLSSAEWHNTTVSTGASVRKVALYVTNFPDNLPLFRLRQSFEVCGMLSDVYVARHRNARSQEFGFVRYVM